MNKRKTESANLENKRVIFLEIGLVLSLVFTLIALEWKSFDKINYIVDYSRSHFVDEDFVPIQLKKKEIVPTKPQSFMVINTVPDDEIDDEIFIDVSMDEDDPLMKWDPPQDDEEPIVEALPYYKVEVKPEFPGGEAAMLSFIALNFRVPRVDLENGISGKMFVGFTIDAGGNVSDLKMLRSFSPSCDEEAFRVMRMMPKWKPGKQGIHHVSVIYSLPINVKLM